MPGTYTKMSSNETAVRFRIRNPNTTGGQADGRITAPCKGRIKRALIACEAGPSADWVANLITPQGTLTGGFGTAHIGHANIGDNESFEVNVPDTAAAYVEVGDFVHIDTTTGMSSTGPLAGWLFIE